MSDTPLIVAQQLEKRFYTAGHPLFIILAQLFPRLFSKRVRQHAVLQGVSFRLQAGRVLGVVGLNGAGKSTLLQMIAGIYQPDGGRLQVHGRVAALLELGAGFNPELTGRENIHLYGALLGIEPRLLQQQEEAIIAFSGIGDLIDQPVRTYSSGMFVRLAFSVATAVQPDVLIIDEALSVGDGAFARKSFQRIMDLKAAGTAIVFCSHLLYQVEVLADEVLWLHEGTVRQIGSPETVINAYQLFLEQLAQDELPSAGFQQNAGPTSSEARLLKVNAWIDGVGETTCRSGQDDLIVEITYRIVHPQNPPTLAVVIDDDNRIPVSSCSTFYDGVQLPFDRQGTGRLRLRFPHLPLLKGSYHVNVYLMCEQAVLVLDAVEQAFSFTVTQTGHEIGKVMLPHQWESADQVC
ncbi:MAG TPA: ABC transporter ATP-binding protein [Sulfurivirga caldicuralii]|nr:ABC transporter ATP-binding protein [Sulfurivirga caldicuralii]